MNRFQQRAALVPRAVTWAIALPLLAAGAYWCINYAGLYRVLAEWQLHAFHSYYPKYTGIITLILCLVPAAIAIQVIGGLRAGERSPTEAAAQVASYAERRARNSHWIQSHRRRLTGLVVTAMLAGAGVYFTGLGLLAGDRVSVDAGAIERGDGPGGRYVEVAGRLVIDDAISVAERGRSSTAKIYIPLVSPEWRSHQPVRVYLETSQPSIDRHAEEFRSGRYEGMLSANGLPGVAITSLAEAGHPAPDQYWVLDHLQTPEKQRDLGYAMFTGGAIAGLLTVIGWAIAGRRERAAAARPSA